MGSGLIVDSARSIDKSLIEVKGLPFVERMRASLPNIPDEGKHVIETKASPSSTEAVMKICECQTVSALTRIDQYQMKSGQRKRDSNTAT